MASIAFAMLHDEPGHLFPAFALARKLQRAGHEVTFVGLADDEAAVRDQGFSYLVVARDAYPAGWERRLKSELAARRTHRARGGPARAMASVVAQANLVRRVVTTRRDLYRALLHELPRLKQLNWDLLIADASDPTGSLVANKLDIPCVYLWTCPFERDPTPRLRADSGCLAAIRRAAQRVHPAEVLWSTLLRRHGVRRRDLLRTFDVSTLRASPSDAVGWLHLPTLVPCPPEFDFQRSYPAASFFVEPLIDLERRASAFDWGFRRPQTRLIYASMGTQSWQMNEPSRFFRELIDSVAHRAGYQMLLSVGQYLDPAALALPPNVVAVRWAPQLQVLEQASLMITHGGLNSVKECIYHGVPMLVFPVAIDQPGNAARVQHHKLGLASDCRRVDSSRIRTMCDEILNNPLYRLCVDRMRGTFRRAEESGAATSLIERLLTSPTPLLAR